MGIELNNLFDESQDSMTDRFSTVLICFYVVYQLFFYVILKKDFGCKRLPDLTIIIFVFLIQFIQIIIIYKLYLDSQTLYLWLVLFIPPILYVIFRNYFERKRKRESKKLQYLLYKLQSEQNNKNLHNVFNADTTTTGIHSQLIKQNANQNAQQANYDTLNSLLNVNPQQMNNLINSNNVPTYSGYMNEYNSTSSQNSLANNNMVAPPYMSSLDPYKNQFSELSLF